MSRTKKLVATVAIAAAAAIGSSVPAFANTHVTGTPVTTDNTHVTGTPVTTDNTHVTGTPVTTDNTHVTGTPVGSPAA